MGKTADDAQVILSPPRGARLVVAGGCGGIGRSLVRELLGWDCRVAIIDMPASIAAHKPPDGVTVVAADATDAAEVDAAVPCR